MDTNYTAPRQLKFVTACKEFFGFLPGETLQEFSAELKALTAQDREDLKNMFKTVGIEIVT